MWARTSERLLGIRDVVADYDLKAKEALVDGDCRWREPTKQVHRWKKLWQGYFDTQIKSLKQKRSCDQDEENYILEVLGVIFFIEDNWEIMRSWKSQDLDLCDWGNRILAPNYS